MQFLCFSFNPNIGFFFFRYWNLISVVTFGVDFSKYMIIHAQLFFLFCFVSSVLYLFCLLVIFPTQLQCILLNCTHLAFIPLITLPAFKAPVFSHSFSDLSVLLPCQVSVFFFSSPVCSGKSSSLFSFSKWTFNESSYSMTLTPSLLHASLPTL